MANLLGNLSVAFTYDIFITFGLITAVPVSAGKFSNGSNRTRFSVRNVSLLFGTRSTKRSHIFTLIYTRKLRAIRADKTLLLLFDFRVGLKKNTFLSLIDSRTVSAIDITIHDVQFYGMKLAGIILISIGFLLVMFPNNWPEYIFRLLR